MVLEDCTQTIYRKMFWKANVRNDLLLEMMNESEGRCPLEPWETINMLVQKSLANTLQFMTILVGEI